MSALPRSQYGLVFEGVPQHGRAKLGRVIGLLLVTSKLRRKYVITRSLAGALRLNFRANRFEDLVRLITSTMLLLNSAKFDILQDALIWAFNTRWDHFRVLTRPVVGHGPLLLHPEPSAPWWVPEKALWEERDSRRTLLQLLSVKAHLEGRAITGLTFQYNSDLVRKLGFTESNTYQKMDFGKHERLVRLEVRSCMSIIRGITVSPHSALNTAIRSLCIDSSKLKTANTQTGQAVASRFVL